MRRFQPDAAARGHAALPAAIVLALSAAFAAHASHIEETLSLSKGWNAVYIESTPEDSGAQGFWSSLPVTKATCYRSTVYSATAQLSAQGTDTTRHAVSHLVWDIEDPTHSTMGQVIGGLVYFVYATQDCEKTFKGVPQVPRVSWQVSSDGGLATYASVAIPAGEEVAAKTYFADAPCGVKNAQRPYKIFGEKPEAPSIAQLNVFKPNPKLSGGKAYAFESEAVGDWPGVLEVETGLEDGLAFPSGISLASFSVHNASTTNREISLTLEASAKPGETPVPLYIYSQSTDVSRYSTWEAFTSTNATLEAGATRRFVFRCNKSDLDSGLTYGSVLAIRDLGGTKMRVRLPVTAAPDAYDEDNAAFPAGLWVGSLKIAQVADKEGNLMSVAKPLSATMLLHVDSAGAMTLLQRVAAAQEADSTGAMRTTLYKDLPDVPSGVAARRLSSIFIDTANRAVAAGENTDTSAPEFGREATFRFTVAADSKENPFRHAWHPDHDGRKADYSGPAPSGDVLDNFIGPVKPEMFSVTNTIILAWRDDNGVSTRATLPEEITFGAVDWYLDGLRKERIKMRGLFSLKRVTDAAVIKEGE